MDYHSDATPVEQIILAAAKEIKHQAKSLGHERKINITQELLGEVAEYLISTEWFETAGDLRCALEDGDAWEWLKIPGALKLQMKKALLRKTSPVLQEAPLPPPPFAAQSPSVGTLQQEEWHKEWDPSNNAFYYVNFTTGETSWDHPPGFENIDHANSCENYNQSSSTSKKADTSVFGTLDDESDSEVYGGELVDESTVQVNEDKVQSLVDMGFQEDKARAVLADCMNSVEDAVAKLMNT
mmetsp:Transcript_759/g.1148  ORF Transcript_759/g.1148 Transcript_759/m.1148 type:complete len:240 (+) Transcript_759:270-989(+)|eukprot:CAMPEP_0117774348 /NCGR_PEP_ID=MMETSP0947-20121206/26456_1 /TAXON_ID=44440 /ORGANISM="Chattonella subsalsa, Strain CCMP2191" /LENGTH=239 /DNA_ID=CAMNT_0005600781 /DNA_START=132 /DNA_END=851 /DNA_ORIENTATION=-